jgi:hypothetical protein
MGVAFCPYAISSIDRVLRSAWTMRPSDGEPAIPICILLAVAQRPQPPVAELLFSSSLYGGYSQPPRPAEIRETSKFSAVPRGGLVKREHRHRESLGSIEAAKTMRAITLPDTVCPKARCNLKIFGASCRNVLVRSVAAATSMACLLLPIYAAHIDRPGPADAAGAILDRN